MKSLRILACASLGVAFCVGCGDSSQKTWESKSLNSATKAPKLDEPVNNDAAATDGESEDSHKGDEPHQGTENPHGPMNPHGAMPMGEGGGETRLDDHGALDIESLHFTVPKSWIPKPHNAMLQAEFALPMAEGDKANGRLTVSMAGGTVEGNVERWKGQFGTKPDKANEETIHAGGIKILLVDFTGTFADSMGPMAPAVSRPDYRLLGAIFEVPGRPGLHFVKCTGPVKTVTAHAGEVKEFLNSLKVDK